MRAATHARGRSGVTEEHRRGLGPIRHLQLGQDGTRYFDVHHTEHDRIDQIEPEALAQNVACWAAAAWLAAQAPLPFGPPTL